MNKKVDFPQNSLPVSDAVLETVRQFDKKELYWLSGYCSGLADARDNTSVSADAVERVVTPVSLKTIILYASQTGNSQALAEKLQQTLEQNELKAELASLADYKPTRLKDNQVVLMVASTHGEGEPPDDAMDFHEFILGKRAPKLAGVKHSVLSLGDSSYEFYCQTGKDFDEALIKSGSTSLVDRVDCDVDYEEDAQQWITSVVEQVSALSGVSDNQSQAQSDNLLANDSGKSLYTRENPFSAVILDNQKITGRESVKSISHLEISLESSGIDYQPGDSLGVWAKNNLEVVTEILTLCELKGDEVIQFKGCDKPLQQALTENLELSLINKDFVTKYAELAGSDTLKATLENGYQDFIQSHQIVDVIKRAPKKLKAQQLVDLLKPIKPRMYSIASSLQANPEEVHLTVALVESHNEDATRFGTASHYLLQTLKEDDEVLVYVDENRHFKLPQPETPLIMIGPGTGIAPFRAFLQEREETDASGENWLFFGNPNFNTDFLYQVELQKYLNDGLLTQLNVAFSRDQKEKIYVQDRLLENAESIWQWLNEKQASLYVCGDMSRMAKDVHAALVKIISEQGEKSVADAEAYLKILKKDNRYQRDVY